MRYLIILPLLVLTIQLSSATAQVHDQETTDIIQLLISLEATKLSDEKVTEAANSSFALMGLARSFHGFPVDGLPDDVPVADARAVYQTAREVIKRWLLDSDLADKPSFLLNPYREQDL